MKKIQGIVYSDLTFAPVKIHYRLFDLSKANTQKQRRQMRLEKHYQALAVLGLLMGLDIKGGDMMKWGKRASVALYKIEQTFDAVSVAYCSGSARREDFERAYNAAYRETRSVFNGSFPPGFHLNSDPRGYALKIDAEKLNDGIRKALSDLGLSRDMGGYYLLAPEINGKP